MANVNIVPAPKRRVPMPRGIATSGPALLSYGFRPFFLLAGIWAIVAMCLWVGAISGNWQIGGSYGAIAWHAHEMVFGYAVAVLAGFMLTAIPNWTGRLPVSGVPLLALGLIWCAGRFVMLLPDLCGPILTAVVDGLFLFGLAFVAGREIVVGRNWKNLKMLVGLVVLALANACFHVVALFGLDTDIVFRLAIAALVMLVTVIGGRIIPSFTRNWLSRQVKTLPAPFSAVDQVAIIATVAALAIWIPAPEAFMTAVLCVVAALAQGVRLWRWRGWTARAEPIVAVLHLAYAFIPLGLVAIGASAVGWTNTAASLHILTVGVIGNMTLAVMTRATLGHTGRSIAASNLSGLAYVAIFGAAIIRPAAEMTDGLYLPVLGLSAALWIISFALFLLEYGPMLWGPRQQAKGQI